jgi:hypothetical protein
MARLTVDDWAAGRSCECRRAAVTGPRAVADAATTQGKHTHTRHVNRSARLLHTVAYSGPQTEGQGFGQRQQHRTSTAHNRDGVQRSRRRRQTPAARDNSSSAHSARSTVDERCTALTKRRFTSTTHARVHTRWAGRRGCDGTHEQQSSAGQRISTQARRMIPTQQRYGSHRAHKHEPTAHYRPTTHVATRARTCGLPPLASSSTVGRLGFLHGSTRDGRCGVP